MNYKSIIESLLYIWGEPLSYKDIAKTLDISPGETKKILNDMIADCKFDNRGIELKQFGDGYQYVTKQCNYDFVQKLVNRNESRRITNSSMEVLSIIAYKQPITRIEIEEIRGVKSSGPIDTLVSRDLIKEVGRLEQIGRPILYGTTDEFLRVFDLKNLKELPQIEEIQQLFLEVDKDENQ
ncbi:SMC-Scp complex subunit ScpB [Lagierella sp.]|uniref:SMC-Scp complex subunit ScpB n=1 Tax=Lagierella sp. TaxID=2849657 RepID=UPI00262989BA|nr:SMC-Scp complex subunit ScpB [Lagierella sp.]